MTKKWEKLLSKARLRPYEKDHCDPEIFLQKYQANVLISEAFFPTLHYLEVLLRNRLDQVLTRIFGNQWLLQPPSVLKLSEVDIQKIQKLQRNWFLRKKIPMHHDDMVAQMSFGFWCSFFHKRFDPILWHKKGVLREVFPYLSPDLRKRSLLEAKIFAIKELRNRIAHHEPIWNQKNSLQDLHRLCYEIIESVSQEALALLVTIDRFPDVYQHYQGLFQNLK